MKNIVFAFSIAFLLSTFQTISQNSNTILNVDGAKINIPTPNNAEIVSDINNIGLPENFIPPEDCASSAYIETSNDNDNSNKKQSTNKYMIVKSDTNLEESDYYKKTFEEEKDDISENCLFDKNVPSEKVIEFFDNPKKDKKYVEDDDSGPIGFIYEINNAFGVIYIENIDINDKTIMYLYVKNIIRVNERKVITLVVCKFDGDDSVNWVIETSKKWTDAILNSNE